MEILQSKGTPFKDPFIYLGTGGTIYMYYRLYLFALRTKSSLLDIVSGRVLQIDRVNNYLGKAVEAFQVTNHEITKMKANNSPSFFMGPAGVYTLGALIYSHIDDKEGSNVDKYLEKVLSFNS